MPEILFNIRVYGLWVQNDRILVTDEIRKGRYLTKFPGGGLQFGEGLREALHREWKEETGQSIDVGRHFYTTDFFQRSAFDPQQQVISVFYRVHSADEFPPPIQQKPFSFPEEREGAQVFRWLPMANLSPAAFTFPIEQTVAKRLCS